MECPCPCQERGVHLQLPVALPPSFSLRKAVCSYGFFMTAPNLWIDGVLQRPLRLSQGQAVLTRTFLCTSSSSSPCLVTCLLGLDDQQLTSDDRDCIAVQVLRMLRLSDMESVAISNFHALHPQAKGEGFGRIFRSPTLFEDMVKSCLLCNCGWGRTLSMARALCELQAELKGPPLGWLADGSSNKSKELQKSTISPATPEVKDVKRKWKSKETQIIKARKLLDFEKEKAANVFNAHHSSTGDMSGGKAMNERKNSQSLVSQSDPESGNMETSQFVTDVKSCIGDFPSAEELAGLDASFLAKRCGLGYRAKHILKLAKDVCTGLVDLKSFETLRMGGRQVEDVRRSLLHLQGFGPFTCANVLMCIGEFSSIPADTETVRHLKQVHGRRKCTVASVAKEVMEVYASYAPFQFLAYWFELWGCYEKRFGQLSCMEAQYYGLITGRNMSKKEQGASIEFDVAQICES